MHFNNIFGKQSTKNGKNDQNDIAMFKKLFVYSYITIRGWIIVKKIIKRNPDKILIFSDKGVGDQVFMFAYLKKWVAIYDIKKWAILTTDPKNSLYRCFSIEESRMRIAPPDIRYIQLYFGCIFLYDCF